MRTLRAQERAYASSIIPKTAKYNNRMGRAFRVSGCADPRFRRRLFYFQAQHDSPSNLRVRQGFVA